MLYPHYTLSLLVWLCYSGMTYFLPSQINGAKPIEFPFELFWNPNGGEWFLRTLFQVSLAAGGLWLLRVPQKLVAIAALAAVVYSQWAGLNLWNTFTFYSWYGFFLVSGALCSTFFQRFSKELPNASLILIAVGSAAVQWYALPSISDSAPTPRLQTAIPGIFFISALSMLMARRARVFAFLAKCGRGSLEIYFLSSFTSVGARMLLEFAGWRWLPLSLMVSTLVGVCVSILMADLAIKYGCSWLFRYPLKLPESGAKKPPYRRAA